MRRFLAVLLAVGLASMLVAAPAGASPKLGGHELNFGEVEVGSSSAPQDLTLTNFGSGILVIEEIDLAGANGDDFEVLDHGCSGARLSPGDSCVIQMRVSPSEEGILSGTLVVEHSAYSSPDSFRLWVIGLSPGGGSGDSGGSGGSGGTGGSGGSGGAGGTGGGGSGGGSGSGGGTNGGPNGDSNGGDVEPRRIGKPLRIHTRVGLLNLGRGGRVAVATVSCPKAKRGSCRLQATASLGTVLSVVRIPVRTPRRIPAGSWARVFVVIPGTPAQRVATARGAAKVTMSLSGRGPGGARSQASLRRSLVP